MLDGNTDDKAATADERADEAGGSLVPVPAVVPAVSRNKPVMVRPTVWKNADDPRGHIRAMAEAIKDDNVARVKKLRGGYPLHLFKDPEKNDIDSFRDDPVAIAARLNRLQCLDVLVNYPGPAFTAANLFWPQENVVGRPKLTVFEKFLSEPVQKKRLKDRIVVRLMQGRGGKLVHRSRWNVAGRMAIGHVWTAALDEAFHQGVYQRDKWFLYNDALRIACSLRNFASLSILLKYHPYQIGPQIVHEMVRELYNGPPTKSLPDKTAQQVRDHDLANINLCVIVLWGNGFCVSRSKLPRLSRTHHDFVDWYRICTDPNKVKDVVSLTEVALAFKCPLVIGQIIHDDPTVYWRLDRERALRSALVRPAKTLPPHDMKIHDVPIKQNIWARAWSVSTHKLMSKGTRDLILQIVLCFARISAGKGNPQLPGLPIEMWYHILTSGPL